MAKHTFKVTLEPLEFGRLVMLIRQSLVVAKNLRVTKSITAYKNILKALEKAENDA